ncbi:S8 family serine peptidase [Actinocrispum sp. NPDC049592]|uniref:S8 family serine peptidase n=1 Tax=Actinocrispum sp. NPDC049592 TaxID=3154835 RepID=UPI00343EBB76
MGVPRVPRILGMAAVAALTLAITQPAQAAQGQVLGAGRAGAIKDSYIVQIKDSASPKAASAQTAAALVARYGGKVRMSWQHALNGFAATMTAEQASRMAADSRVELVEQDAEVRIADTQPNPPSWGLDRIDQRDLPLNSSYTYDTTASNVHAYVIDTGIRITHSTFGGRATWGTNTVGDGNNTDCNGHGTHVAGTIGGSQYGVAKGVQLVAVKVLDCNGSGSFAGVADGINWVAQNAIKPAVANMSLGAQGSDAATENAVRGAISAGVTFAIASGNSNANACNFTPARVAEAITVNASDINDARASFSNFGTCTDIFAPGVNITSSWNTNDTATNTISGTSMATPHTAGAAALWLATHPNDTPAAVQTALVNNSTPNKITNPGTGSPNRLLFTSPGAVPPGSPSVNNPGPQTGTVGVPVSLQLSGTGGTPPYTWSASGLPAGLSASSSGLISGTPTTAGVSNVTVTVTDSANKTGSASFTWTITQPGQCTAPGQKIGNPGFETATAPWTSTAGVIGAYSQQPAHGGTRVAWMDGYGTTHTDTLSQTVTIPAGCTNYSLSFWLHIDSAESTTTVQYDKLTVQVGTTTLATYSNLNKAAGYSQKSFNVGQFAGQTVTLKFTGTEDISLQTSFVVDDVTLTVS